jgi:hypothetical protein
MKARIRFSRVLQIWKKSDSRTLTNTEWVVMKTKLAEALGPILQIFYKSNFNPW